MINIIVKKIDLKSLNEFIAYNKNINFLIMNSATEKMLNQCKNKEINDLMEYINIIGKELNTMNRKIYSAYRDIPIAICEKLKDGEIEIK